MPISKLSASTALRLKSSVVLLTPDTVVKELIDNALDAEATSIEVQISANTVDKIQVRDNGTGINREDFNSLARPSHTSKLRSFDELELKAGQTLGFRGEALASATDIAQTTIVTRTNNDTVAMQLVFSSGPRSELSPRPISAPVGTTVTLVHLFDCMPVRKREYRKKAPQCIINIKRQLIAYVLARPRVKITLKVLGEKKMPDWSYAPARPPSTRDAAVQGLGIEVVSNCTSRMFVGHSTTTGSADDCATLKFNALMPKPGANPKAISGYGAFISVDSRPMTALRGTMKKMVDIFKTHLRRHFSPGVQVTKPFLQLDIATTPGSYDVNITSAKDEVMFVSEQELLRLFEDMCLETYPVVDAPAETRPSPVHTIMHNDTHSEVDTADTFFAELSAEQTQNTSDEIHAMSPLAPEMPQDVYTERSRLQHALDDTLPGLRETPFSAITLQQADQIDEGSAPSTPIPTEARLVGSKIDLMRTKTTSTVDDSDPLLSVQPWPEDLEGPCESSGTVREKITPWTIAGSTAKQPRTTKMSAAMPTAVSMPMAMRKATSPPPTPQPFETRLQELISLLPPDAMHGAHRRMDPLLLTPTYGGSPLATRNQQAFDDALAPSPRVGGTNSSRSNIKNHRLPDTPYHRTHLSGPNGMNSPGVENEREVLPPGRHAGALQIHATRPSVSNRRDEPGIEEYLIQEEPRHQMRDFQHQPSLGNRINPEERVPWISHQAPSPDMFPETRMQEQGGGNALGIRRFASPLTLHQYLGEATGNIDCSPRPNHLHTGTMPGAFASGEPLHCQRTATPAPRHSMRSFMEELGPEERLIDRDCPSNERPGEAQESCAVELPPHMPLSSTKDHHARSRLNSRRRSTSQVGSKMPKRSKSSGLPLESIERPTTGTQLVLTGITVESLAVEMDMMATYDAYILTGALSFALRGGKLTGPVEHCVRVFATNWLRDMTATADQPETRPQRSCSRGIRTKG